MTELPRVLIAGIGNIFLGDDGFGIEVATRLRSEGVPEGVVVTDFGIRGVHLAFELTSNEYDAAILVDAMHRDGAPGTLYVIEPDASSPPETQFDAHNLTPDAVLAWLTRAGGTRTRITIIGCEPASVDESIGLSPAVAAAVDRAVGVVRRQLAFKEGSSKPCA